MANGSRMDQNQFTLLKSIYNQIDKKKNPQFTRLISGISMQFSNLLQNKIPQTEETLTFSNQLKSH